MGKRDRLLLLKVKEPGCFQRTEKQYPRYSTAQQVVEHSGIWSEAKMVTVGPAAKTRIPLNCMSSEVTSGSEC